MTTTTIDDRLSAAALRIRMIFSPFPHTRITHTGHNDPSNLGFGTAVTHLGRAGPRESGFVNPPIVRGSTVVFPTVKDRLTAWSKRFDQELVYGICGTPTHHALEVRGNALLMISLCLLGREACSLVTSPSGFGMVITWLS